MSSTVFRTREVPAKHSYDLRYALRSTRPNRDLGFWGLGFWGFWFWGFGFWGFGVRVYSKFQALASGWLYHSGFIGVQGV